jgi:esterase/lipase/1-acyl-sn-glycerol-3-phosphate acyltransferase
LITVQDVSLPPFCGTKVDVMTARSKFAINEPFYKWSVRAFSLLRKRIGMKIEVHAEPGVIENGQIFPFNHFARFETIIPQYFIYQATGAYCRCVATHELFESSERFANVLWGVGAVPSNHPGLLAFLAAEILRGQKVIIFPEGGMMKDRGMAAPQSTNFMQLFRPAGSHRQGAAALALVLEVFKKRILSVYEVGDTARLARWVSALGLKDQDALIAAARKPTLIVPSNITFHPLHTGENVLLRAAEFLKFKFNQKGREELMVEGNLLLRNTDMDIRFGKPMSPDMALTGADRMVVSQVFAQIDSLDDLFGLKDKASHWVDHLAALTMNRTTRRLRDLCMVEMYANVTLNISHLASALIMRFAAANETEISKSNFYGVLYAIIKQIQREPGLHLHRSLHDPDVYDGIHRANSPLLDQLIENASNSGLIAESESTYTLLPALRADLGDHDPRLVNIIRVYANEIASLTKVRDIIAKAIPLAGLKLAQNLHDDQLRSYTKDKHDFKQPRKSADDLFETEKKYGNASLIMPTNPTRPGVILVHAFLASPAEFKDFGHKLVDLGHPVLCVRLKGHGTTPWDLRERSAQDWQASVRRGYEIMSHISAEVLVVGFATGASLALLLAAEKPERLAAVIAVSAPIKFRVRNLRFAPLLDRINKLSEWVYAQDGVKPFQQGEPEHPEFQYSNMPVRALVELRKITDALHQKLPDVTCPVTILHGSNDPVIDPASATIIFDRIGSADKKLHIVESQRHSILHEDIDNTHAIIIQRLSEFVASTYSPVPLPVGLLPQINASFLRLISPLVRGRKNDEDKEAVNRS